MPLGTLWKAYSNWLHFRKPERRTPLLGNPMEISGHAPSHRLRTPAFSRAEFGKYEKSRLQGKRRKIFLITLAVIGLCWIAYHSIMALGIFSD